MATDNDAPARPPSLVVAAAGALLLGLVVIGFAIASMVSGHGSFSGAIGGWLAVYGLVGVASAVALWRRSVFGRGPVVTMSALNLIVAATMASAAPWAWAVVVGSAITLVAVSLPATTRALHWSRVRPAGELPPTDAPGS
ncbi:MAG: hypothetical protein REI45_05915 [Propionicimonas sp.]|nr:hypothetical protein [Propionicimonas sp.]